MTETITFKAVDETGPAVPPFVHILIQSHDRGLSGTLIVSHQGPGSTTGHPVRVLFDSGVPVAATSDGSAISLESVLVPLCAMLHGGFVIHEGEDLTSHSRWVQTGRIDPYALVALAFRQPPLTALIHAHVSLVDPRQVMVRAGTNLARYGFSGEERAVADELLSGYRSVTMLVSDGNPAAAVRRVVHVLRITGVLTEAASGEREVFAGAEVAGKGRQRLESHERPRSPLPKQRMQTVPLGENRKPVPRAGGGSYSIREPEHGRTVLGKRPGSSPPPPPEELSASQRARWREIAMRYRRMQDADVISTLDLGPDADPQAVRFALFEESERWDPSKLPLELAPLRTFVQVIFDDLIAAFGRVAREARDEQSARTVKQTGARVRQNINRAPKDAGQRGRKETPHRTRKETQAVAVGSIRGKRRKPC